VWYWCTCPTSLGKLLLSSLPDAALRREGWRLVFVLRLSPCVPFVVVNYALGLTSISFLEYSLASAVSIIPFVLISVYLGLASGTALQLLQDGAGWSDRSLINPQSTAESSVHVGARKFSPPINLAAATTAESTDMYRDRQLGIEASTTIVTIAGCFLAVVTGAYAVWFIRRATAEALEGEPCERAGAAGGLAGMLSATSAETGQSGTHRDAQRAASYPSHALYPAPRAEKQDAANGEGEWGCLSHSASGASMGTGGSYSQADLPCDTAGAVNGEGKNLRNKTGWAPGRTSRESSMSSMHTSLQSRWSRWSGLRSSFMVVESMLQMMRKEVPETSAASN
jgi:hypothetical protein